MKELEKSKNLKYELKNNILKIEIDLSENNGITASGNKRISTSGGNKIIPDTNTTINLNIYEKQQK